MDEINSYVLGPACKYSQLGYGLFRFLSTQKGETWIEGGDWPRLPRAVCNCVVRAQLEVLIAEHRGIANVKLCRVGGSARNTYVKNLQSFVDKQEMFDSISFEYNHMDCDVKTVRGRGRRWHQSSPQDSCHAVYNFLVFPLEWMLTDAVVTTRGVCDSALQSGYGALLGVLRERLVVVLTRILPEPDAVRFQQNYGTAHVQRRITRRKARLSGIPLPPGIWTDSEESGDAKSVTPRPLSETVELPKNQRRSPSRTAQRR